MEPLYIGVFLFLWEFPIGLSSTQAKNAVWTDWLIADKKKAATNYTFCKAHDIM